jgi:transposase
MKQLEGLNWDQIPGCPPYHPGDLLKLYLYGYLNRIHSSRQLERESHRNVEEMWPIKRLTPDCKTIAGIRRNNTGPIRLVCREFTNFCKKLELFREDLVAIDGLPTAGHLAAHSEFVPKVEGVPNLYPQRFVN